jgi:hypothetical protein
MRTSKVTKRTPIDLSVYYNMETGEVLAEEVKTKTSITIVQETDQRRIYSKDYSMVESAAILSLKDKIPINTIGIIVLLSITTKTESNILYNNNTPHTNKTLQEYLNFKSESQYFKTIKQLISLNILHTKKYQVQGKIRTIYMMNPYVCRKRAKLNDEIFNIFTKVNTSEELK